MLFCISHVYLSVKHLLYSELAYRISNKVKTYKTTDYLVGKVSPIISEYGIEYNFTIKGGLLNLVSNQYVG